MKRTFTRYEVTCMFRAMQVGMPTPGIKTLTPNEYDAAMRGGMKFAEFIFSDDVTITDEGTE